MSADTNKAAAPEVNAAPAAAQAEVKLSMGDRLKALMNTKPARVITVGGQLLGIAGGLFVVGSAVNNGVKSMRNRNKDKHAELSASVSASGAPEVTASTTGM